MLTSFHPDAQAELNHAPTLWPLMDDSQARRCLIHRFPYGVIYALDEEETEILILAVMHLHREPGCWSERA